MASKLTLLKQINNCNVLGRIHFQHIIRTINQAHCYNVILSSSLFTFVCHFILSLISLRFLISLIV